MAVPSFLFLFCAALAAAVHAMSRSRAWRMAVKLLVNVGFLLTFAKGAQTLAPYLGFLLVGYLIVRLIGRGVSGRIHAVLIAVVVAAFLWLKHYSFIPSSMLLRFDYLTVGLSYVFFRVVHLAIIASDDADAAQVSPIEYINYTLDFTSLVSGPIQEFEDYKRMTNGDPASLTLDDFGVALERIITGMFKFSVMATLLSLVQREVATSLTGDLPLSERALLMAALAAAYPVFLFFNFSGYTDFVIGVARLFRIELPENFNKPFRAVSFIDYWSRWHMSLSNWLKAHVYNPLLLNSARRVYNPSLLPLLNVGALFVTFFLIGLWHGPTWHFVFFGVLNGAGVAVNQFYRIGMQRRLGTGRFFALNKREWYKFIGRGLTFAWVSFTLLWFWSDWPEIGGFARSLGPLGLISAVPILVMGGAMVIGTLIGMQHGVGRLRWGDVLLATSPYLRTVSATLMLLAIVAVNVTMSGDTGEVVYKSF